MECKESYSSPFQTFLTTKYPNEKIVIDVDCSWIACLVGRGKQPKEIAFAIAKFLVTLAQAGGFIVSPILDGDSRHHSKRATTSRNAKYEQNRIGAIQARFKALAISSKINNGQASENDREELCKLNTKAEKLEKYSAVHLTNTFESDLRCSLEEMSASLEHESGGYVSEIRKAILQADYVIAYRSLNKMNHIICSKDTNFAALIGKDCLLLRGWKLKSNGRKKVVQ